MKEIQEKVQSFTEGVFGDIQIQSAIMDLTSEVGELNKEVLIATEYGKKEFEVTDSFKDELGDVMYSLITLANKAGIDMEESLNNSMDKYLDRYLEKNKDTVDWLDISRGYTLSPYLIRKYKNYVNWIYITLVQSFDERFIREFMDRLDLDTILKYRKISDNLRRDITQYILSGKCKKSLESEGGK